MGILVTPGKDGRQALAGLFTIRGRRFGIRLALGITLFLGIRLGDVFLFPALEISFVPATSFETETGGGYQFLQGGFATGRAIGQRSITDFLELFHFVPTFSTTVFVDRHESGVRHALQSARL